MTRPNTPDDYEAKIDRSGGVTACHEWTGRTNREGYGEFSYRGGRILAHRFGWVLQHGEIPEGLRVCHTCDNPPCQNPRHFFLGTQLENIADRDRKGRTNRPLGESNGRVKLTDDQVSSLRSEHRAGIPQSQLARKYGIHKSHVSRLVNRTHTMR